MARILVADDEPEVRRVLVKILTDGGHETFEAYDGLAALHYLKEIKPDFLLLDWMMPEIPGNEVLQAIRNDEDYEIVKDVKVIVLSDFDSDTSRRTYMHMGADFFVPKRDDVDELRDDLLLAIKKLTA